MAPKTMKAKAAMKAMKAAKVMSKGALATELAEAAGLKKNDITKVLDSLAEIGTKEVKKAGKFTLPGLCMIKTRKKKAGIFSGAENNIGGLFVRSVCFILGCQDG